MQKLLHLIFQGTYQDGEADGNNWDVQGNMRKDVNFKSSNKLDFWLIYLFFGERIRLTVTGCEGDYQSPGWVLIVKKNWVLY